MHWDIFCRVIDNHGDLGVCWRLARNLAERHQQVRLWVDDARALHWMAPGAGEGRYAGITVRAWDELAQAQQCAPPAQVWVEGFGCEIAPEFIAARADAASHGGHFNIEKPVWINLEYLSAEPYAARSHGLPSPLMSGPARGWTRHFYFPGFDAATGGLLREPDLLARQAAFDAAAWLRHQGITRAPGERLVSLFCYEPHALPALLQALAAHARPTRLLLTAGRAADAVHAALQVLARQRPDWNARGRLRLTALGALTQTDYDHLLWACDANAVRGEDSLVRALWAGKPLLWQIYPQDDGVHLVKLQAFLDCLRAPAPLRQLHALWNATANSDAPDSSMDIGPLDDGGASVQRLRAHLLQHQDLATQLIGFVQKKR